MSEPASATSGRRFAKDAAWMAVTQGLTLLLGAALSVVVTRMAGLGAFGEYSVFQATLSLASVVFGMGQDQSCIYFSGQRPGRVGAILGTCTLCTLAGSALGVAVLRSAGPLLVEWGGLSSACVRAILVALPVLSLLRVGQAVALGMRRTLLYNILWLVSSAAALAGVAGGIRLFSDPLRGLLDGWNAGNALSMLVAVALALHICRWAIAVDRSLLREGAAYGLRACAGTFTGLFFIQAALYALKWREPDEVVGCYSIAFFITQLLSRLVYASSALLSTIVASDSDGSRTQFAAKVIRHFSLVIAAAGLAIGVLAPFLIPLVWGPAAAGSIRVVWILLPGAWCFCMHSMLTGFLAGKGYPVALVLAYVGGIATNLGLCALWIPSWHAAGAALAASVSYLVAFSCVCLYLRSTHRLTLGDLMLLRKGELGGLFSFLGGLLRG